MEKQYSNESTEFTAKPENEVTQNDIELINKISRKQVNAEDVYCFSVILCDNDIDRDYEQFSVDCLNKLSEMFVGKSALYNHKPKTENQCARIYYTEVRAMEGEFNSVGEEYYQLYAKAYIPKSSKNQDLIDDLEYGIKKEISVGCNISQKTCSICGADNSNKCKHLPGKTYDAKLCFLVLNNPTDAYEWSFVAIPAQRKAGVIKQFDNALPKSYEQVLKSLDVHSVEILEKHIDVLKAKAQAGEQYIEQLKKDLIKLNALQHDPFPITVLQSVTSKMCVNELCEFKSALASATERAPSVSQLCGIKHSQAIDNANINYKI